MQSPAQKTVLDMDQAKPTSAEEENSFGDWDIRREQNVRPRVDDSNFDNIEKKNLIHSTAKKQNLMAMMN